MQLKTQLPLIGVPKEMLENNIGVPWFVPAWESLHFIPKYLRINVMHH